MQKVSKFAVFSFQECDKDLIDELANFLDEHAIKVYEFFGVEQAQNKVEINIIPTKSEFDEEYKRIYSLPQNSSVKNWIIGTFHEGVITYLSLNDYKNTAHKSIMSDLSQAREYYKKNILHEFVHYVNEIFNKLNNCPETEKYLVEGIATYLSGQATDNFTFDFSCEDLLVENKNFYDAYYLITKYFVENYDKQTVLKALRSSQFARQILKNELFNRAKAFYTK